MPGLLRIPRFQGSGLGLREGGDRPACLWAGLAAVRVGAYFRLRVGITCAAA